MVFGFFVSDFLGYYNLYFFGLFMGYLEFNLGIIIDNLK